MTTTPDITGISPDTGISDTDGITDTGTLTVNGTAGAGTTIDVFENGTLDGTGTTAGNGTWSVALTTPLAAGSINLTASATSGNVTSGNVTSPLSAGYAVTVDTTPPTVTSDDLVGASPNNASTEQFTVDFAEPVFDASTSAFTLAETGTVDGTIASVSGSGTSYTVTVTNVTGNGTMQLDLKSSGTGITDTAGNAPGGFTSGETYTITDGDPLATLVTFDATDGANPYGGLIADANGDLFGTTYGGGRGEQRRRSVRDHQNRRRLRHHADPVGHFHQRNE